MRAAIPVLTLAMLFAMTFEAENHQIPENVGPAMGPELLMMNLQVKHGTTVLAAPVVPLQDLLADQLVLVLVTRGHRPAFPASPTISET